VLTVQKTEAVLGRKKKPLYEREMEVLYARVKFDIYRKVETIAKREGLTLTQVVRKAVTEYVEKYPQVAA